MEKEFYTIKMEIFIKVLLKKIVKKEKVFKKELKLGIFIYKNGSRYDCDWKNDKK